VRPTGFAQFKPINHNSKMLQFRNDSGFFPTRLGKPEVFTLYMENKGIQSQRVLSKDY
jgi:hypothetical protein